MFLGNQISHEVIFCNYISSYISRIRNTCWSGSFLTLWMNKTTLVPILWNGVLFLQLGINMFNMKQNAGVFKAEVFSISLFLKCFPLIQKHHWLFFQSRWFCKRQGKKSCARKKTWLTQKFRKKTISANSSIFY